MVFLRSAVISAVIIFSTCLFFELKAASTGCEAKDEQPSKMHATSANMDLLDKGLPLIEDCDGDQQKIFELGKKFRDGKVEDFVRKSPERSALQFICFWLVTIKEDNLYRRAQHNLGKTLAYMPYRKLGNGMEYSQLAYYYFSRSNFLESRKNMGRLLASGRIVNIVGNKKLEKGSSNPYSFSEAATLGCDSYEFHEKKRKLKPVNFCAFLEKLSSVDFFQNLPKEQQEGLESFFLNVLAEVSEAQSGEEHSAGKSKDINFDSDTLGDLRQLYDKICVKIRTTPLHSGQDSPVGVFIGRSPSWLYVLHQELKNQSVEFKHVLATELASKEITDEQIKGFKGYLDSLGFKKIAESNCPVLLIDFVDTARSLIRMQRIMTKIYPNLKNRLEYISLLSLFRTINLPRSRAIRINSKLAKILFAKHDEQKKYCLFPEFKPMVWPRWEEYLPQFQPALEALALKKQLQKWVHK